MYSGLAECGKVRDSKDERRVVAARPEESRGIGQQEGQGLVAGIEKGDKRTKKGGRAGTEGRGAGRGTPVGTRRRRCTVGCRVGPRPAGDTVACHGVPHATPLSRRGRVKGLISVTRPRVEGQPASGPARGSQAHHVGQAIGPRLPHAAMLPHCHPRITWTCPRCRPRALLALCVGGVAWSACLLS